MKEYDENKVLRSIARVAHVEGNHIILKSDAVVGIHTWGKLDYLVNYKGYIVSRSNNVVRVKSEESSQKSDKRTKNYGKLHRKDRK